MEYETDDANKSWFDRVKESPRTVSALIIILIVAAAIYAFSGDQPDEPGQEVAENTNGEEQTATTSPEPTAVGEGQEGATATTPTATPVSQESIAEQAKSLPQAEKTEQGYNEVAERGNGVTHLARRATARYLAENSVNYTLTNEHRIYIEDYIKDNLGAKTVTIGQTELISFDLIKEAVESAGQLNERQLQNLSRYTHVLG